MPKGTGPFEATKGNLREIPITSNFRHFLSEKDKTLIKGHEGNTVKLCFEDFSFLHAGGLGMGILEETNFAEAPLNGEENEFPQSEIDCIADVIEEHCR